jgi:hypothetical protein
MTAGLKNSSANPYFLVVSTISSFYTYSAPGGSGGSFNVTNGAFTPYNFAGDSNAQGTAPANTSSLLATGNMLRDMGKTVTASGSTFRKVQLLASSLLTGANTTGITGVQGQRTGYLTGYILLGNDTDQPGFDLNVARVVRLY